MKSNDRIKAGDIVMFKSAAKGLLKKWYIGQCTVIELLPYDNVKLQYREKHLIRNINQLKRGKIKFKSDYNDIEISVSSTSEMKHNSSNIAKENSERRYPNRHREKPIRLRWLMCSKGGCDILLCIYIIVVLILCI